MAVLAWQLVATFPLGVTTLWLTVVKITTPPGTGMPQGTPFSTTAPPPPVPPDVSFLVKGADPSTVLARICGAAALRLAKAAWLGPATAVAVMARPRRPTDASPCSLMPNTVCDKSDDRPNGQAPENHD